MRGPRRDDRVRINERIRVREVRVIDETGAQLGIKAPAQAVALARSKGLDLVEVAATAVPPVCRITDYGKYQYNEQKKQRQARKHQKTIEVKEVKFRPKVDLHDYDFKKRNISRFLHEGDKVKAVVFFRGREIAHPEIGRRILERLINELNEIAVAENIPRMEGNTMHTILSGRPGLKKVEKPSKPEREPRPEFVENIEDEPEMTDEELRVAAKAAADETAAATAASGAAPAAEPAE
jgi:translation initiation factor IF-3